MFFLRKFLCVRRASDSACWTLIQNGRSGIGAVNMPTAVGGAAREARGLEETSSVPLTPAFLRMGGIGSQRAVSPTANKSALHPATTMKCSAVASKQFVLEQLPERELIRVEGEEVVPFLQGLITNDMFHLKPGSSSPSPAACMYSMFLNKGGRVLYDTIIYRTPQPNSFLVECDRSIASELRRHIRIYRVRRKINIDLAEELRPWVVFDPLSIDSAQSVLQHIDTTRLEEGVCVAPDPRLRDLGLRVLAPPKKSFDDLKKIFNKGDHIVTKKPGESENYRLQRYRHGVAEGVVDLPPGKSFALEANGDFLHGISFQKGCYIGQELTARVFHTGVVRKRLMPLRLTLPVENPGLTVRTETGANVGSIRGFIHNRALGVMRVDQVLNASQLMVENDSPCYVEKPEWWPRNISTKILKAGNF